MSENTLVLVLLGVSVVLNVVQFVALWRAKKATSRLKDATERVLAALTTTTGAVTEANQALVAENEIMRTAKAEIQKLQKLADFRFDVLDGVIQERDQIWQMYWSTRTTNANAQEWLFRELKRLQLALNKELAAAGKPAVSLPPQLEGLVKQFVGEAAELPSTPPFPGVQEVQERAKAIPSEQDS